MTLRCTSKVLDLLGVRSVTLSDAPPTDDDWYRNLLWIDRRKCLLLTHAGTLFSTFVVDVRTADLLPVRGYVTSLVEADLCSERLPADTFGTLDSDTVRLAKTAFRSRARNGSADRRNA